MISAEDNELLTRTGPGTAMGKLMREFWVPACLSSELKADGDPMRLKLLGEDLIAFRDTGGRVGIMDHRCPHRCASLFFGRNEHGGLRCIYHGWKFDADGKCIDMPNVPPEQDFKSKVHAKAYRTAERNGLVYAYMGQAKTAPPLPELEALLLPEDIISVYCCMRESNWLQSLEGDIDHSHFGFLHLGSVNDEDVDPKNLHFTTVTNRAPKYHCKDTSYGTSYCAYRPHDEKSVYYRFAHFHMPFWSQFPNGTFNDHIVAQAWVPMDDTHTMGFLLGFKKRSPPLRKRKDGSPIPGLELDANAQRAPMLPNSSDWFGRFRPEWRRENDFGLDRDAQRTNNYSGLRTVPTQDQAMVESMGQIVDRTLEHLSPSDLMVVRTRRRLIEAARRLSEEGIVPEMVNNPGLSRYTRSGAFIADSKLTWEEAYDQEIKKAMSPTGMLRAAE